MSNVKDNNANTPGYVIRDGERGFKIARFVDSMATLSDLKPGKPNEDKSTANRIWSDDKNDDRESDWTGGLNTLPRWTEQARDGWPQGVKRMRDALETLAPKRAQSIRRRRAWMDQGDEIDIHRVYAGNIDRAWQGFEPRKAAGSPVVKVWIEAVASAMKSASSLFWRGAAGTVVVEALERAGYKCEVWVYEQLSRLCEDNVGRAFLAVKVKDSHQMLDIERFTLLTAHPGTYRTAIFGLSYALPWTVDWGKGACDHGKCRYAEDGDVVVKNVWNKSEAQAAINKIMARFS